MRVGGRASVTFAQPAPLSANAVQVEVQERVSLYVQPEEDILLLGEMIRDIQVLQAKARSLPTSGADGYRGDLRVMRGAARRIIDAVDRLLGDNES